jgi:iron(III) transport system substrate-binding protein
MRAWNRRVLVCIQLFAWAAPAVSSAKTELWVYTSVYKEFIAPIAKEFEEKNPGISVQVFQAGSEKIQAKLEAELMANKPQADFVMTSDPFWGAQLAKRGLLLHRYQTNYYSLMIMIAHKDFPPSLRPVNWTDLENPRFNRIAQMGSPLESGTMFVAVAYLSDKYGWDYFDKLRTNTIGCNGGNSTVIQKVESNEKKVGMVLLENALAARKRGSPIDIIYPTDGGIPIPSVQFIPKASPHAAEAEKFSAFVLSPEGQRLLRAGYMYPVNSKVPDPEGALPFAQATLHATQWTADKLSQVSDHAKEIKKKFDDLVLE